MRRSILLWTLCVVAVTGCLSSAPTRSTSQNPASDSADALPAVREIDRDLLRQMIAETPQGALVRLHADTPETFEGTFLKGNSEEVELMNCIARKPVPGPKGVLQLQTSHTPFQSFQTARLSGYSVSAPPPPGFVPPDLSEDGGVVTVMDVIYRDGHLQSATRRGSFERPDAPAGTASLK